MTKNKAFTLITVISFLCFVAGLILGGLIQEKNDKFWQEVILEPEQLEQIQELTEQNEAMVDRLIQLQQEIDEYWLPQSSPDIVRPSREE